MGSLDTYDYVLWIDVDAIFFNLSETIETWIEIANKKAHLLHKKNESQEFLFNILVAKDKVRHPFNAGVMLIRSSLWSKMFYYSAFKILSASKRFRVYEQPVLYYLRDVVEDAHKHMLIYENRKRFQAFTKMNEVMFGDSRDAMTNFGEEDDLGDSSSRSYIVHNTRCSKEHIQNRCVP